MDPYVGFEHPSLEPDGWRYDIKRWCSFFDLRLPTMPRLADASSQGVSDSEYFKSGVVDVDGGGLMVDEIDELIQNHERHWVPIIRHGHYARYRIPFFLYGDNSRVEYVDPAQNKDGRNYIELAAEPEMADPILAATFKRHPTTGTPSYMVKAQQSYTFSGIYVDEEEQETVTALGRVNWSNVDTNKKEFIVDHTKEGQTILRFNKDYTRTYGVVPQTFQDLAACKILGLSNGTNYQVFRLPHFPVLADDSFHLYVVSGYTWEEWERVDTWFELLTAAYPNQNRYFLDKDLGIIYTGSGVQGGIPPLGSTLVAAYTTTLRIEYEEVDRSTEVEAWSADVSPVAQQLNQGFVCLTHDIIEPAYIRLEINKAAIPFTHSPREYGPILTGSDHGILKATVTSPSGLPVPHTEVGFTMSPSSIGYLAGAATTTGATNTRGEAYAPYQPPVSANELGFYTTTIRSSTNPYYPNHKDLIITMGETGLEGREDEIYLYQVLKNDVLLGYSTLDNWIYQNLDYPAWVVDATSYARWKEELIAEYDLKEWAGVQADGTIAGRKVVVYKIDPTTDNLDPYAINPVTGLPGAVMPVRPTLVEKIDSAGDPYNGLWRALYPEDAVPDCDPDDANNNLGGYWLASTRLITFRAHCWSAHYNRIIYSNEIVARITLPDYLLGVYINSLMQEIPFGWKLPTDTDNVAAGLDGMTFITINPHSGPYRIIDLVQGTTSPDWASAPFKSIGFQINI
jgi:hypothetical protein